MPEAFAPGARTQVPGTTFGTQMQNPGGLLQAVMQWYGKAYMWGGESLEEGGFDCSGLVYAGLQALGIKVGRSTAAGYATSLGKSVDAASMQPGDLLFYTNGTRVSHVAVYAGNGWMFDAARTGTTLGFRPLRTSGLVSVKRVDGAQSDPIDESYARLHLNSAAGANPTGTKPPALGVVPASGGQVIQQGMTGAQIPPPPQNATEPELEAYFRKYYGAFSWMLDVPDLRTILFKIANEGLGPEAIQAELQGSPWYQEHQESLRTWIALKSTDPATAERQISQRALQIRLQSQRLGINIDEKRARDLADQAIGLGWDDTELQRALVRELQYKPDQGGALGMSEDEIKGLARKYLVPISDQTAFYYARMVAMGEIGQEAIEKNFRDMAKARFPNLAAQIDSGISPDAFFAPYRETVARTLEINPDQVDLMDPKYSQITEVVDEKGNRRPMTLTEVQTWARSRPEYDKTQQAEDLAYQVAPQLGQRMGLYA